MAPPLFLIPFRYGIMSVPAPGMAPGDPAQPQPDSFDGPPLVDRIDHVLAAGRFKSAMCAQHGRQGPLIQPDGKDEELFDHALKGIIPCTFSRIKNGIGLMCF